jgi:ElaA protein
MGTRATLRTFDELSSRELYAILALRQRVFVVEQACAYLDADGLDEIAHHLFIGDAAGAIAAYLRILPPDSRYPEPSLGRVVSSPEARRSGLGRAIVARGIEVTHELYPGLPIHISAQRYLERFYGELGFVSASEPYLEDDIPHVGMILPA